jgi:hypothetical protein
LFLPPPGFLPGGISFKYTNLLFRLAFNLENCQILPYLFNHRVHRVDIAYNSQYSHPVRIFLIAETAIPTIRKIPPG